MLSPRVLGFGRKCIYWSCLCWRRSERLPGANAQSQYWSSDTCRLNSLSTGRNLLNQVRNENYDIWYSIVDRFNNRNIKFKSDVLPAISGLAEFFSPILNRNDQYLAGLWRDDIANGLLWCVGSSHSGRAYLPRRRVNFGSTGFQSPSWSWVSFAQERILLGLHDAISFPGGKYNMGTTTTKLISSHTELQNHAASYGHVESGYLRFFAKCPQVNVFLNQTVDLDYSTKRYELRSIWNCELCPKRVVVCNDEDFPLPLSSLRRPGHVAGDAILDDIEMFDHLSMDGQQDQQGCRRRKKTTKIIKAVFLPLLNYHDLDPDEWRGGLYRVMGLLAPSVSGFRADRKSSQAYWTSALRRACAAKRFFRTAIQLSSRAIVLPNRASKSQSVQKRLE